MIRTRLPFRRDQLFWAAFLCWLAVTLVAGMITTAYWVANFIVGWLT